MRVAVVGKSLREEENPEEENPREKENPREENPRREEDKFTLSIQLLDWHFYPYLL